LAFQAPWCECAISPRYNCFVTSSSPIYEFVQRAKSAGTPDESIVGILTARGWPEKEVYEALAAHYEKTAGIAIPKRSGGGTAARDAFFYLIIFSTLATWTIALGTLWFALVDQWFSDSLFPNGSDGYSYSSIAGSLACIIVAFPIYLLVSRVVVREVRLHPEKRNSPVRKWLTYMALVIAAGVFIGDLITVLTYFLRGEITSRFLADAAIVLVLSGGVFFYYFGGVKRSDEAGPEPKGALDGPMAALSAALVIVLVVLGFWHIGGPGRQRNERADERRVQDLYAIAIRIRGRWDVSRAQGTQNLPEHLDELPGVVTSDPVTRQSYVYQVEQGSQYRLCATFSLPSTPDQTGSRAGIWTHPAGEHCFQLDASREIEGPNIYVY
jgi:hypothetical protein